MDEVRIGDRFTRQYVEVVEPIDGVDDVWGCRTDDGKHRVSLPLEEIERRNRVVNDERGHDGDILIRGHEYMRVVKVIRDILEEYDMDSEKRSVLEGIINEGGSDGGAK